MSGITTIRNITKTYRHINRYRKILSILLRNGFGFLFNDLHIHKPFGLGKVPNEDLESAGINHAGFAKRLRATLVELGPAFVKLGQLMSCRPDIFPAELIEELSKLHDHVTPFPFEQVRKIIREDFHGEIEDYFSSFDEYPIAAASVAQGHHAVLKDGKEVFVKVQRPNIMRDINVDLEILGYFARHIEENCPEYGFLRPSKIVEQFASNIRRELDFNNEKSNMLCFAKQFSSNSNVVVPKPVRELCSMRVLTMDYINGIKGNNVDGMKKAGIDIKAVAELGVKILMEQFFNYGFFHGDPHPGNMFILQGPKICYVDFGDMGRLTQSERVTLGMLLTEVFTGDNKTAAKILLRLTTTDMALDPEDLERDWASLVDCHLRGNVAELNVVNVIQDFYDLCYRQKLCLKPHIYQMMKALGYADAMGRTLAPDFEIFAQIRPFITEQALKKLEPLSNIKQSLSVISDWGEMLKHIPSQVSHILNRALDGSLYFHHKLDDISKIRHAFNASLNRICSGIVLAGMLVASSIVIHAQTPPLIKGVSIIGILGFIQSFVVGTILLWSILRSGDNDS